MVLTRGRSALRKIKNEKEESSPVEFISHIPECVALQKKLEELKEQQKYLRSILSQDDNKVKIPKTPKEGSIDVSTVLLAQQDNNLHGIDMKKKNILKENTEKVERERGERTKQVIEIRRSKEQDREKMLKVEEENQFEGEGIDTVWDRTIVDKSYGEIEMIYETPK
uniref:Rb_C domain-containing protein n=1 Tax=Strongyloides venezuelensis TaxID=75913 RepID=A0A0K0EYE3_STRVS